MKVYITKHAFDRGVFVAEAERIPGYDPDVVFADWPRCCVEYGKPHWHETQEEALNRVLEMVAEKITCLDRVTYHGGKTATA